MPYTSKAETKMSKYTFYYTLHESYEAVVYANSFEEASDHVYEQGPVAGHQLTNTFIEIDDYTEEAIDA